MKSNQGHKIAFVAVLTGAAGLAIISARAEIPGPYDPPAMNETSTVIRTPEKTISAWPIGSRRVAAAMIEKYGEPGYFDENRLEWNHDGQWLNTIVYREAHRESGAATGKDVLEQSIAYDVPADKVAALKLFDPRIKADPAAGELFVLSENENFNYLALNLADEIVSGKRTASEARAFYRRTAALSQAGKNSVYMYGFLFPMKQP